MSRRGGGGRVPIWLIAVLMAGFLGFAYVERSPIKAMFRSAGVVVGTTEGAGGSP